MRSLITIFIVSLFLVSCGSSLRQGDDAVISVSIAPFAFFVEQLAGDDFVVNVMVPPGADPHTYEPAPARITALRQSKAYIANGYLDFELAWLERFREVNRSMEMVELAGSQDLLHASEWQHGDHMHYEGVDPHFWLSPLSAKLMAGEIKSLLLRLRPERADYYEENYKNLIAHIDSVYNYAAEKLGAYASQSFFIYHPVLAYFARDFNLMQVAIEYEGKEPSPRILKELIDKGRGLGIKIILVQEEFDQKSAAVIADDIGAVVVAIDPLSSDWTRAVNDIIKSLAESFAD